MIFKLKKKVGKKKKEIAIFSRGKCATLESF
jgi:hypothetical protein